MPDARTHGAEGGAVAGSGSSAARSLRLLALLATEGRAQSLGGIRVLYIDHVLAQ